MKKNVRALVLIAISVILSSGVSMAESPKEITVSAAISLKNAFEELGKRFEERLKRTNILFNFGSSGTLRTQIERGAPVDIFAPADTKDMDLIAEKGMIIKETRINFATNNAVLIAPAKSKFEIKSFADLTDKNIKRIAIGNPKTVPAGRYAQEIFAYYKIAAAIKDKLVFTEHVRQVLDYVARGEVDAGIVYLTDTMVRPGEIKIVAVAPKASHSPIAYPIAVVAGTKNEALAREFILLVTSKEGKIILEKYGFKTVR
jgi:molybdate transport system substrate-binding protein